MPLHQPTVLQVPLVLLLELRAVLLARLVPQENTVLQVLEVALTVSLGPGVPLHKYPRLVAPTAGLGIMENLLGNQPRLLGALHVLLEHSAMK